ncbi:MAG: methyltransferase domain-containing protein [Firmicutes bacterium]|nr:methyltransferase domain-containing protein [Bacillota bacterium]
MNIHEAPFDQFQRYEICKRVIDRMGTGLTKLNILDVGGYSTDIEGKPWLPAVSIFNNHNVFVIDTVECEMHGYMTTDATNLPFDDNSFDFVITNDVLEHIEPYNREQFLNELIRVSKNHVILNTPYYTPQNVIAEKFLYEYIVNVLHGENRMLEEHLIYGLPKLDDIKKVLNKINVKYCYCVSSDTDNWLKLMVIRHELLSRGIENNIIKLLDIYYNKFSFEKEIGLQEGYRLTLIIDKDNSDSCYENCNFLKELKVRSEVPKIDISLSTLIELYKLKSQNEEKDNLDLFYYDGELLSSRMSTESSVVQTFKCHSHNLYKIGLLVATYKEKLSGLIKVRITEKETNEIIYSSKISGSNLQDNDWLYLDFIPRYKSINKEYKIKITYSYKDGLGPSFYFSERNKYGTLTVNGKQKNGSLAIKVFVRNMDSAEKYFFIEQSYNEIKSRYEKLSDIIEGNEKNISSLIKEREQYTNIINSLTKTIETLETQEQLYDNEVERNRRCILELEQKCDQHKININSQEEAINIYNKDIQMLSKRLEEKNKYIEELEKHEQESTIQIEIMKSEIHKLTNKNNSYSSKLKNAKNELRKIISYLKGM